MPRREQRLAALAINARTGDPLGMDNGRDGNCLERFFSHFSEEQKEDFRLVFRAKDENEAVLRLIRWIRMCMESKSTRLIRFAKGIRDKFNEVVNGVRCRINSARIESANAAIKRIQAKACGLADTEYLFLELRQIRFLRLQRRFKTPRASACRFETDPEYQ